MTAKGVNLVAPLNKTGPVLSMSSCICKSFLRWALSVPRKLNTESVFLVLFLCEQSTPSTDHSTETLMFQALIAKGNQFRVAYYRPYSNVCSFYTDGFLYNLMAIFSFCFLLTMDSTWKRGIFVCPSYTFIQLLLTSCTLLM